MSYKRPDDLPPLSWPARIAYAVIILAALAALIWSSTADYHDILNGVM